MGVREILEKADYFGRAARRERLQSPEIVQKTKAVRHPNSIITGIKIFEVQSPGTGDGVYSCYEQVLDSTQWADTTGQPKLIDKDAVEVEVLNLLESHVVGAYTRGLARYDKIRAWQKVDDEGNMRWVGYPLTPKPRMFKTTEAATANDQITCNAMLDDGTEAASAADILYEIEIYFQVLNGAALNSAAPRLLDNKYIWATHIRGKWWCVTPADTDEECDCYSAP